MCHQIVELYSSCRCLYYQHAVDRCAHYGRLGHSIRKETVLIGDACHNHDYTQSPRVTTTSEDPLKTGSTEAMDAKSTPKLRLKPRPGASGVGVSCHSTISKDYTAGEGARKAELLACFGRRLRGGKEMGTARRSEKKPRIESVDTEDGHAAAAADEHEYKPHTRALREKRSSKLVLEIEAGKTRRHEPEFEWVRKKSGRKKSKSPALLMYLAGSRDTHPDQRHGDIGEHDILHHVPSATTERLPDDSVYQLTDLERRRRNEELEESLLHVNTSTDLNPIGTLRSHHPPAKSPPTASDTREHATVRGNDSGLRRLADGPSLAKKPERAAAVQDRRWNKLALRKQEVAGRDSAAL